MNEGSSVNTESVPLTLIVLFYMLAQINCFINFPLGTFMILAQYRNLPLTSTVVQAAPAKTLPRQRAHPLVLVVLQIQ